MGYVRVHSILRLPVFVSIHALPNRAVDPNSHRVLLAVCKG